VTAVAVATLVRLVSLVVVASRVFGVTACGLTGGAFPGVGNVVWDLLGWSVLGHLIGGLTRGGTRRTHRSVVTHIDQRETLLR
jgi:hypothetical protein